MKSILAEFRASKIVVLTILKALNLDFLAISRLKMSKTSTNSKLKAAQMVKIAVLGLQNDQN